MDNIIQYKGQPIGKLHGRSMLDDKATIYRALETEAYWGDYDALALLCAFDKVKNFPQLDSFIHKHGLYDVPKQKTIKEKSKASTVTPSSSQQLSLFGD